MQEERTILGCKYLDIHGQFQCHFLINWHGELAWRSYDDRIVIFCKKRGRVLPRDCETCIMYERIHFTVEQGGRADAIIG